MFYFTNCGPRLFISKATRQEQRVSRRTVPSCVKTWANALSEDVMERKQKTSHPVQEIFCPELSARVAGEQWKPWVRAEETPQKSYVEDEIHYHHVLGGKESCEN